ncbi:MAG: AmmeMemoRadiSam system protein B, partial [Acidobacteriota bacterium]|nr:AmmeMemoRadiSam system protein B [Acidobacteriota bacterium]
GSVAAHASRAVMGCDYDVVVLVGPSHYEAFEGVAVYAGGSFETPLGRVVVDAGRAERLLTTSSVIEHPTAHTREHALEMQLPFLQRVLPDVAIVPLLIGEQERVTILELAAALVETCSDFKTLLVASTDLSHYFDAKRAAALDQTVIDCVARFDAEALLTQFEQYPRHERGRYVACGGGAAVAVMRAAATMGAREARVLQYADSGDVSGDKSAVVGYLAAVLGRFHGGSPKRAGAPSPSSPW